MPAPQPHAEPSTPAETRPQAALREQLQSAEQALDRLHGLVSSACAALLQVFDEVAAHAVRRNDDQLQRALDRAVTALQFEDIASQLIRHVQGDLARATADASSADFVPRPGPVSQSCMQKGDVDLF